LAVAFGNREAVRRDFPKLLGESEMQSEARIREIQSRVDAERTVIAALDGQLSDSGLKQQLQQVEHWLDDVESIFLRSAMREPRTPDALSRWLAYAMFALQMAIEKRKNVQEIVAKYGPNAQSIG
jgi:hypothetical protein